ncbi:MAG: hypothetical protein OXH96_22595 [Spirochaetaceae bacterium]|nr:hypothetical protein [Spirochaetaceae bacterium]MDE0449467.1 hypothetical protein [Spirochaetaceae bacterium]
MLTLRVLLPLAGLVLCLGFLVGALVYFHVQDRRAERRQTGPHPDSPAES